MNRTHTFATFPNPVAQVLTVELRGGTGATSLSAELFNCLGQQVMSQKLALPGGGTTFPLEAV